MATKTQQKTALKQTRSLRANSGRPKTGTEDTRARRLRSIALEIFVEFGYERAKLSDIARRAGASKETLYSQYGSKEELFLAVLKDHLSGSFLPFESLLTEERRSIKQDLEAFVFRLLSAMMSEPQHLFAHLIFSESQQFPELGKMFWENAHISGQRHLSVYFERQMERGRLAKADSRLMACQFLQLAGGDVILKALLNVQRSMTATEKRRLAANTVSLFLKGYGV